MTFFGQYGRGDESQDQFTDLKAKNLFLPKKICKENFFFFSGWGDRVQWGAHNPRDGEE